jgi:NAD(P)-dependent dehydrogenase (short-subunit alcohol dehydrogenase family)
VAYHFAELGANVTIAGRSVKDGEAVLGKLRSASPRNEAEFDFVQFDASLKSDSIAFADQMSEKYKKNGLYALVMTHGAAANGDPRKETSEGHERCTSDPKRSLIY